MNTTAPARIPVNLITGFLGVGKTTAILHLLACKPASETWAVLVNEFGEIGIDGAILDRNGTLVKEVAGGCLCCVNGLPMQVALNLLLARRPRRLIIEPSGLGHPDEILRVLQGGSYAPVVELRATLTLVDPQRLTDGRVLASELFQRQALAADRIVANKTERCSEVDRERFFTWVSALPHPTPARTGWVSHGRLLPEWLDEPCRSAIAAADTVISTPQPGKSNPGPTPPEALPGLWLDLPSVTPPLHTVLCREKSADGYFAIGWLYPPSAVFDLARLLGWMHGLDALRIKAVVKTPGGACILNADAGAITTLSIESTADSRIEIIAGQRLPGGELRRGLDACQML